MNIEKIYFKAAKPGSGLTFGHELKRNGKIRRDYSRGRVRMSDLTPACKIYLAPRKAFISAWKRAGWSHMMKWALSGMRFRVSFCTGEYAPL